MAAVSEMRRKCAACGDCIPDLRRARTRVADRGNNPLRCDFFDKIERADAARIVSSARAVFQRNPEAFEVDSANCHGEKRRLLPCAMKGRPPHGSRAGWTEEITPCFTDTSMALPDSGSISRKISVAESLIPAPECALQPDNPETACNSGARAKSCTAPRARPAH